MHKCAWVELHHGKVICYDFWQLNLKFHTHWTPICLQSNDFVCIWHQGHLKVNISLAFAFKITILYIFGVKCIFK